MNQNQQIKTVSYIAHGALLGCEFADCSIGRTREGVGIDDVIEMSCSPKNIGAGEISSSKIIWGAECPNKTIKTTTPKTQSQATNRTEPNQKQNKPKNKPQTKHKQKTKNKKPKKKPKKQKEKERKEKERKEKKKKKEKRKKEKGNRLRKR